MYGIDFNQKIEYKCSSLCFFNENERHVNRLFPDDVLLLVFDGVLRFCEDGTEYEVPAGHYHIQKQNTVQMGTKKSDSPKYLYVHFLGTWNDSNSSLAPYGEFDYEKMKDTIEEMDYLSHNMAPYILQAGKFFEILSGLYKTKEADLTAQNIADYIEKNHNEEITLEMLSGKFFFSKNHIINLFKKNFGVTPVAYINNAKLKKAEYFLKVTYEPIEKISGLCGFQNYSHFYKLFVRKNGISPKEWRNRCYRQIPK